MLHQFPVISAHQVKGNSLLLCFLNTFEKGKLFGMKMMKKEEMQLLHLRGNAEPHL